jgi:hypothetical protein
MKKTYVKPDVFFESFAFTSNIAGSCGELYGIHSQNAAPPCMAFGTFSDPQLGGCKFYNGGLFLFNAGCDVSGEDGNPFNLCYHVPTDDAKMFAS